MSQVRQVLAPEKRSNFRGLGAQKRNLEIFAKTVESLIIRSSGDRDAMANLVCRMLTSNDAKIAAPMLCKWVEWRYGKAREAVEHSGPGGAPIQIISYIPRPGQRVRATLEVGKEANVPEEQHGSEPTSLASDLPAPAAASCSSPLATAPSCDNPVITTPNGNCDNRVITTRPSSWPGDDGHVREA